jgi:hypothetical protein
MFNNPVANYVFDFKHNYQNKHPFDGKNSWIDALRRDNRMSPLIVNTYKNYMIIKYRSLIESFEDPEFWDKYDQFYQYSRSLVIDFKNENIVLWPYKKFFNINERAETSYENIISRMENANTVYFSEKLDGSYIAATYYMGEFVVSSSSGIDPSTNGYVAYAYNYISNHENVRTMIEEGEGFTYIFELIEPDFDQHVVDYSNIEHGLYLTGVIDNEIGISLNPQQVVELAEEYDVLHTNVVDDTIYHILSTLGDVPSNEAEGFVLYIDGFRVKIKYDSYVELHGVLSAIKSPKLTIAAMRAGNLDDFISKIPAAYHDIVMSYVHDAVEYEEHIIETVLDYMEKMYSSIGRNPSRKEAMIYITENMPKEIQSYARNIFLGRKNDYLKHYKG